MSFVYSGDTHPKLAVGYHLFDDWDTAPEIRDEIKST